LTNAALTSGRVIPGRGLWPASPESITTRESGQNSEKVPEDLRLWIPDSRWRGFRNDDGPFAVRKILSKQAFYDRERLLPKAHAFE
jgi:hypothetical protein